MDQISSLVQLRCCLLWNQPKSCHCDLDNQTPPCVIFIRMLYWKVVLANTLMLLLSIILQENLTLGQCLKKHLKIILGTSQTLVKMQGIHKEWEYYCLKNFTFKRCSLQYNNYSWAARNEAYKIKQ